MVWHNGKLRYEKTSIWFCWCLSMQTIWKYDSFVLPDNWSIYASDIGLNVIIFKFDPFVWVGNCDQACFIPYLRVCRLSRDEWWAYTKVIPQWISETSNLVLTTWQDDRHDQVPESSLLLAETLLVNDVSDYDITLVNHPIDEYVSDSE